MFRVDSRFEIHIPPFFEGDDQTLKQFHLVEQCFNVPLWHIQVLPQAVEKDDFQRWSCYLVTRATDALGVLRGQQWEGVVLHVVLPKYMTRTDSIAMARCTAIWECRVAGKSDQVVLLFDTPLGAFVDPEFDLLDASSVSKVAVRWIDPGIEGVDPCPTTVQPDALKQVGSLER